MSERNYFTTRFSNYFSVAFAFLLFALAATTVRADAVYTANLNGSQEIPANASAATGTGSVILNSYESQIAVSLNLNNLQNVQSIGIYGAAQRGATGSLIFNFPLNASTKTYSVTQSQISELKSGLWYFNVVTSDYPNGVIRGQIEPLCSPPPRKMTAWYRAENNANDSAGENNGAAPSGVAYAEGKVGQSFNFNGVNQYVNLGNQFSPQNFTISMWVKPAVGLQNAGATIVDNNATATANWSIQQYQNQTNHYYYHDNGGDADFSLTANQWQHLVIMRTQYAVKIYRDGILLNFMNFSVPVNYDNAQVLYLARAFNRNNESSNRYWKGQIDEFTVYERLLEDEEIRNLYYSGAAGVCGGAVTLPERKNGKIVFSRNIGITPQIFSVNNDGTDLTNLTNSTVPDFHPSVSPDNTKIAFSRNWRLYSMDQYGFNQTPIISNYTGSSESLPRYSPDGSKILFALGSGESAEIYTADADGTNLKRLTNNSVYDFYADWSPDGKQIVFVSSQPVGYNIFRMNADGSNVVQLTYGQADYSPAWSIDGKKIAFVRNSDIFVMRADGTGAVNLTNTPTLYEYNPQWSPDGTKIAFAREHRYDDRRLMVMNTDGSNQTAVVGDGVNNTPFWKWLPNNQNATVSLGNGISVVFGSVYTFGTTIATDLTNNSLPQLHNGYYAASPTYDIRTSIVYSSAGVSITVNSIANSADCGQLQLLHFTDGVWTDSNNGFPSFNAGTCTVTQPVSSLSPFVVARYIPAAEKASLAGNVTYGITSAGQTAKLVSDVSLVAVGMTYASANGDANGSYQINNLIVGGHYTVTPSKTGNVNGITAFDATLVLRCVAAGTGCTLTSNQKLAADANNNGTISAFDATQILRFVAASGATANTGAVGNWKFTPAVRDYASLNSPLTTENYTAILVGEVNGNWTAPATLAQSDNENADNGQTPMN